MKKVIFNNAGFSLKKEDDKCYMVISDTISNLDIIEIPFRDVIEFYKFLNNLIDLAKKELIPPS